MKTTMKSFLVIIVLIIATAFTINPDKGYQVGDDAADFKLENIDGKMVSMANYSEAKGFIIIFTCNTCPYSVANEDRIIALDKKYKAKGYPVIAINPNDPKAIEGDDMADMKVRAEEKGFTFPYLVDKGQKVYPLYGATKTPHVYVIRKEGAKNIVEYIGAIDDSSRNPDTVTKKFVENAVDNLLAGKKPEVTYTRAIGCSIKTVK